MEPTPGLELGTPSLRVKLDCRYQRRRGASAVQTYSGTDGLASWIRCAMGVNSFMSRLCRR